MRGSLSLEPYVRFSSSASAVKYAVAGAVEGDTPGWLTANIRTAAGFGDDLLIGVALENLWDVRYVEHGSYIQAPGRNLVVTASYRF